MKGFVVNKKAKQKSSSLLKRVGFEIGIKINLKKESFIKSAHFELGQTTTDAMKLRVNLYDFEDMILGDNLLTKNVFLYPSGDKSKLSIDLSKLNIITERDVLLTLEVVEGFSPDHNGNLSFWIKTNPFKGNIYQRNASQSNFYKLKERFFGVGLQNIGMHLIVKEIN